MYKDTGLSAVHMDASTSRVYPHWGGGEGGKAIRLMQHLATLAARVSEYNTSNQGAG